MANGFIIITKSPRAAGSLILKVKAGEMISLHYNEEKALLLHSSNCYSFISLCYFYVVATFLVGCTKCDVLKRRGL